MIIGTVSSSGLKLRKSVPNGPVLDELRKGERVEIGKVKRTATVAWVSVRVIRTGQEGYVASRFIDVVDIDPEPVPPPPTPFPLPYELPPMPSRRSWFWAVIEALFGR